MKPDVIYAWGGRHHAFLSADLYAQVNPAKWGITAKVAKKHNFPYKTWMCGSILVYFFYLVVLDMIENNTTFEFPLLGKDSASMYVKCYDDELFKKMYAKGCFKGIDFLRTDFKAYRLVFQYRRKGKIREKPIYINGRLRDWLYDKANRGKQYY